MRKFIIIIILIAVLPFPVVATEIEPPAVPEPAEKYMPENTEDFLDGLWYIIKKAISEFLPNLRDASAICLSLICILLLATIVGNVTSIKFSAVSLVSILSASSVLLSSANTMINLGINTVRSLSDYGKLLLPVMATATAAQGGLTLSTAILSGTTLFISILTTAIFKLIVPLIYIYICISIANSCLSSDILKNMQSFSKWLITWIMKLSIYIFTGYISITGVISGTVDSSAIKATKLAISGVVPVVGNVISDASESVLIGASVMKNAAGVYGILATLAILSGPLLRVGAQYIILKVTTAVCSILDSTQYTGVLENFCSAMGFVLGMIGTISVMLLIGTVCFMKGVTP